MPTKFPEGSMGAADAKSNRNLAIGATVINVILFIIIFFVTDDEWKKGGTVGSIISVIALAASTLAVWFGVANKWNWLSPNVSRAIWAVGIIVAFAAPRIF